MFLLRKKIALFVVMASAVAISTSVQAARTYNTAPTISGTPTTTAMVGIDYGFQPSANDINGDRLRFSIKNKPAWATFNTSTGLLSGVPTIAATYLKITISVSDGKTSRSLSPFSISVLAKTVSSSASSSASSSSSSSSSASSLVSSSSSSSSVSSSSSSSSSANTAPSISGSPVTSTTAGTAYSFRPTASDANGDALGFNIVNKPVWASFNTATGQLSGTPGSSNVGNFAGVTISVSDGLATTSLAPFTITVAAAAPTTGSAALSWTAPALNTDGTTLTDLASYRIYYGTSSDALSNSMTVSGTLTGYTIGNLATGNTWYFAVSSINASGVESSLSSPVAKSL